MATAIPLCILGLLLAIGFTGTIWPGVLYALDSETRDAGPPTPQQLRTVRISSLVMFLLACAGLYAFLTANGPAEGTLY